ncbi:MAG: hypothetical protein SGBAC_007351 [Bacillariaceae sp.]
MQRSSSTSRPSVVKGRKRYTPISFKSKPRPMKSKEQLMEEIMLGTRDLPNPKKPLSAKAGLGIIASKNSLLQPGSPASTESTVAASESSSEPNASNMKVANKVPSAAVLSSSLTHGDRISPMSTPISSPITSSSPESRSRRARPGSSPMRAANKIHPPLAATSDAIESDKISPIPTPASSPRVSPKPRSSKRLPSNRSPVSSRRRDGGNRSLSARRLQQIRTQDNPAPGNLSPLPPPPPLPSKHSKDGDQAAPVSPRSASRGRESRKPRSRNVRLKNTNLSPPLNDDSLVEDWNRDSQRSRSSSDIESLATEASSSTHQSHSRSPGTLRRKLIVRPKDRDGYLYSQRSRSSSHSRSPGALRRKQIRPRDPKRRQKLPDDATKQRTATQLGSRRSAMQRSQSSSSSKEKGYIKSFLGISERNFVSDENDSGEKDAVVDEAMPVGISLKPL